MARFTGKVAIITGSSSGMGKATAILFAQEGAKVTVTGRNEARLQETKQKILDSGVPEDHVLTVQADLMTEAGQDDLITSTITKFGRLDILVNCAGGTFPDESGATGIAQNVQFFDKFMQINTRTVVTLIQKAKEHLIASKGEVVNVSSIGSSTHASPEFLYYAMSKAALDTLTRSLAIELIPHGVRVNSVSPGFVRTGFGEAMGIPEEAFAKMITFMESRKECIPIGKIGESEDIANVIAFLADRKASFYILGQSIVADGGSSLVMGMNGHDMMDMMK